MIYPEVLELHYEEIITYFNLIFIFTSPYARSVDVSHELLLPNNQLDPPFCQSFAMVGLLEHYRYKKNSTKVTLSEKHLVKSITLAAFKKHGMKKV